MRKISFVVIILPFLMLCGCGGDGQKEKYVQIGKESVLEMLESVSDSTKILLEDIEESGLNTSVKYDLIKMTTTILLQQNSAYASLSAGELSQSMREVEEVRLMTVKIQARLEYERDRTVERYSISYKDGKMTSESSVGKQKPLQAADGSISSTNTCISSSTTKSGEGGSSKIDGTKWRLKINGNWVKGLEHIVAPGTLVKIQVYNGGNPVKVLWDWSPNVKVYTTGLKCMTDNIEVSITGGRATIGFWTKDNPKSRKIITLIPDN